ncbi:MAG TPA: arylsulfatase [Acidimicrobiales bacterium]|jgi:arylsulfatase A-like enzyme|nr:arylsulfatase [Acidimicrobiales bacterium]
MTDSQNGTTSRRDTLPRTVLPIPDRPHTGPVTYDAKDPDTTFPDIVPLRPPSGAPNVLLILLDDVGFGASATFGGPCATPTADRLAAAGLRYRRFHTTALCSPTRAALLSGRNHHTVGMGAVADIATSAPGYTSSRPNTCATVAEILRLNGYSTAQFGKCHEVPTWETSPLGPFDRWPTGSGFEHFYGFVAGETHQYSPALYQDTVPIEAPESPTYHLTEDLAQRCIDWIRQQKSLVSDKPFFAYMAPGATHAPHHVFPEWVDRYKGRFDDGWDRLREETFARQKANGVVPADAELTARPAEIPAWDDMPDALKPVLARQMEIYAGFLEHVDFHMGRVIDAVEELGLLDDTLICYMIGDNGASAEGQLNGTFNELLTFNGMASLETPEFMLSKFEAFGGPDAYNHYAVGWAHAMDTPYQWSKQVASHWGGTRNGMVLHWPGGIEARGEIRDQFHHVIDVAPTLLDVAGIPEPTFVHGVMQHPMEGISMRYCFDDAAAGERRSTQYFECMGNRGIYFKGWTACTKHRTPWETTGMPPFDDDTWELYGPDDWTQARNLASSDPGQLAHLQRLWLIEATRHNVLPLDDRSVERFLASLAGRPELVTGSSQILFPGMRRLSESSVIAVKNRSHSVTAEVEVPEEGAAGVVIAQGGAFGGWSLYAVSGELRYCHNLAGLRRDVVGSATAVAPGVRQLRMEFVADGPGLGIGGTVTLFADGAPIGDGRLEATVPLVYSGDETTEVGADLGTPVSEEYPPTGNEFNGKIRWVQINVDESSSDHLVHPEDRLRVIMARQ